MPRVAKVRPLRKEQPYYLIPIMMGMAGVLFSSQLEDLWLQGTVILLSVAVPLFVAGNVLGRIRRRGIQSYLLMAGMSLLTLGAVVAVSGYSESLIASEMVSKEVGEFSQNLGMASLLLGLLVVIYSVVHSQTLIVDLGERFTNVVDHMGEGLILSDADGIVIFVNETFTRMTGIPESEMLGRVAAEFAIERGAQTVAEHTDKREHGIATQYEVSWTLDGIAAPSVRVSVYSWSTPAAESL